MSIANVRAEIAKHYRSALNHVDVQEHGGAFSLEDIKRYANRAPAAIVGCLGFPAFEIQGTVVTADVAFGVFCLTHEKKSTKRDVAALLLAESIAVEAPRNRWNSSASGAPKRLAGVNMYSVELDQIGVAMWAIRWVQQVDLERNAIATLDDFETMHSTYDIGETDDTVATTDITELPQ